MLARHLQAMPTSERVAMLHRVADALLANQDAILAENAKDVEEATVRAAVVAVTVAVAVTDLGVVGSSCNRQRL